MTAYVTGYTLTDFPLAMAEEANQTAQYVARLDTARLLPDLAYSNAATLSFCDSVGRPLHLPVGRCARA